MYWSLTVHLIGTTTAICRKDIAFIIHTSLTRTSFVTTFVPAIIAYNWYPFYRYCWNCWSCCSCSDCCCWRCLKAVDIPFKIASTNLCLITRTLLAARALNGMKSGMYSYFLSLLSMWNRKVDFIYRVSMISKGLGLSGLSTRCHTCSTSGDGFESKDFDNVLNPE